MSAAPGEWANATNWSNTNGDYVDTIKRFTTDRKSVLYRESELLEEISLLEKKVEDLEAYVKELEDALAAKS